MPPSFGERWTLVSAWILRHRVGLLVVLGVVVGLRAIRPWALARVVESQSEARLGRVVHVEDVDLELFAGRVVVEGLSVGPILRPGEEAGEPDPRRTLLQLSRLEGNLQWLELLQGRVRMARIHLVDPEIKLPVAPSQLRPFIRDAIRARGYSPNKDEIDVPVAEVARIINETIRKQLNQILGRLD